MKYFGTDGVRGIPNQSLLVEQVLMLGKALSVFKISTIILGTDTRASKDMFAAALISGCLSVGLNVEYVGVLSTPGIIYLSEIEKTIGVVVTASHNPYEYNGIKIVYQGRKLSLLEEQQIEEYLDHPVPYLGKLGILHSSKYLLKEYHKKLCSLIVPTHLKIAIDCANGATFQTAPLIFNLLSNQCIVIGDHPNGYNINENCGATHLEALSKTVIENNCDLGIAFDGDGDRILLVDHNGKTIDGDLILYILACYYQQKNELQHQTIALTIMSNLGLVQSLKNKGIRTIETPVGDKYVAESIRENNLSLGGEKSGHIILPRLSSSGDGIVVALELIRILEETNTSIEDWVKEVELYPDTLQNIAVVHKKNVMGIPLQKEIETIKEELHQDCKIIVRPSGTEDCIRLSIMAKTQELVDKYKNVLISFIQSLDISQ